MHLKITCQYLGTRYAGFQTQVGQRTVQGELEKALSQYFQKTVKVVAAGRTDAGVHALGQVLSCLCPVAKVNLHQMLLGVNSFLPADISVVSAETLPKFNARAAATAKTYVYRCYVSPARSAYRDQTFTQLYQLPDVAWLQQQAQALVGTHDFTAFCTDLGDKNPVRTLDSFTVTAHTAVDGITELTFTLRGQSFLHNMVRIIVGTLLDGKDVTAVLNSRDRRQGGKTAPARGLTLARVEY